MNGSIFQTQHLEKIIDDCFPDLDSKGGSKLQNLGNLLELLGKSVGNNSYIALSLPIGTLGSYISWFNTSPAISMLVPETRQKYEKLLHETTDGTKKILTDLREELCNNSPANPVKIIDIVAKCDLLWLNLSEEQNKLKSIQPQFQSE